MLKLENLANPPYQFNAGVCDIKGNVPVNTREITDLHPAIRGTHYGEVSDLLDTSGCSKYHPWWTWSVLGMVQTEHGKMIIAPNEWLIEPFPNVYVILTPEQYQETFGEKAV